jgi:hypothetical protein
MFNYQVMRGALECNERSLSIVELHTASSIKALLRLYEDSMKALWGLYEGADDKDGKK